MPTFDERVQALPPELYQEIYDLTFKTAPNVVSINKDYRPPALLQVKRATRNDFAKSYYKHETTFYVDRAIAPEWLRSIDTAGFEVKSEVKIVNNLIQANSTIVFSLHSTLVREWLRLVQIGSPLSGGMLNNTPAPFSMLNNAPARLKFQVSYGKPEKEVWVDFQDLPKGNMDGWASRDAKEWCEWKFGK